MIEKRIVSVEVCDIYKEPSYQSEIVTQGLLWEKLIILNKYNKWFKVKLSDDYIGWIHSSFIEESKIFDNENILKDVNNWYIVHSRLVEITNTTSNVPKYVSVGTFLPVIDRNEKKYTVLLPNYKKYFIDKNKLLNISVKRSLDDIITHILKLEGTSYKWGGKSGFGFDCSGFVQTIFKLINIVIPRDSFDQASSNYFKKVNYCEKGTLVFFSTNNLINHVGMFINNHEFIHSSGYVKIESLNADKENFNSKLSNMDYSFYKMK